MERSRALMLGTTYPPARAAAGRRNRIATMRLRMVVVPFLRRVPAGRGIGAAEEGRHVALNGAGERVQVGVDGAGCRGGPQDAAPVLENGVRHRAAAVRRWRGRRHCLGDGATAAVGSTGGPVVAAGAADVREHLAGGVPAC